MKCVAIALALAGVGIGAVALEDERVVVVPGDKAPFVVEKSEVVRLSGKGIAGSKIEIKIDGPAKVESTAVVRRLAKGRAVIGSLVKQFDLKATDAGKVRATVLVTPPQPDAKPTETVFEFEVK